MYMCGDSTENNNHFPWCLNIFQGVSLLHPVSLLNLLHRGPGRTLQDLSRDGNTHLRSWTSYYAAERDSMRLWLLDDFREQNG